jgi:hypothetical protein
MYDTDFCEESHSAVQENLNTFIVPFWSWSELTPAEEITCIVHATADPWKNFQPIARGKFSNPSHFISRFGQFGSCLSFF